MIATPRLRLVPWAERHRAPFAAMNADPDVMWDFRRTLSRTESDTKFDRYAATYRDFGLSRWAVEDRNGRFLGYAGIVPMTNPAHPLGDHHDIGWRFIRTAWGQGYATEAARAALDHGFAQADLVEVIACTAPDNIRSQAVIARLGLARDADRDFEADLGMGLWRGLVWVAQREAGATSSPRSSPA